MTSKTQVRSLLSQALLGACATLAMSSAFAQSAPTTPQAQQVPPTEPTLPTPPTPPVPPVPPDAPVPPTPPTPPVPPVPGTPETPMPPPAPPVDAMPPSEATPPANAPAGSPASSVRSLPPDSVSSNYKVDFAALDKNADGHVSRAEVRASGNADLQREFHVVDANHNGRLTQEEMKGWLD